MFQFLPPTKYGPLPNRNQTPGCITGRSLIKAAVAKVGVGICRQRFSNNSQSRTSCVGYCVMKMWPRKCITDLRGQLIDITSRYGAEQDKNKRLPG